MLDASNGWARADGVNGFRMLHTTDGGQAWMDVTPSPLPNKVWECQFPKAQMAWISYYDEKTCLLLTTNGGKSWASWAPLGVLSNDTHNYFLGETSCRFFNANDGMAEAVDYGAGSAVYNFFETHTGGLNWNLIPIDTTGTIQISDPGSSYYGGGVSYYPGGKVFIAEGDFMDGKPEGVVRLSFSTNLGKSWRDVKLPLPEKYHDWWTGPSPPLFTDTKNGLLPVWVYKQSAHNYYADSALIFYGTSDEGNTWSARPGIVEGSDNRFDDERQVNIISAKDIFVCNSTNLYVTHDGAKSWKSIKPNIDLGVKGSPQDVSKIEFVDENNGWIVIYDHIYKTSDGGLTWIELPLKILY